MCLQDLGSANGTLYNGATVEGAIHLTAGGRIQIGETEIVFDDGTFNSGMGATMITDNTGSRFPKRRSRSLPAIGPLPDCSKRSKARARKPEEIAVATAVTSESKARRLARADQQSGNHAAVSATLE